MGSLQQFNKAIFSHSALADYEKACALIAQCAAVDAVATIKDGVERHQAYSRQAQNLQTEAELFKIRMRAERNAGEELLALKAAGLLQSGRPSNNGTKNEPFICDENQQVKKITLADLGKNKKTSAYQQACAAMPKEEFEAKVEQAAQQIAQGKRSNKLLPVAAEKPRKKAPVIEHKEEAEIAQWDTNGETFQSLYEQEAAENAEKAETIHRLEARVKALEAENAALRAGAADAVNAELGEKIAALEAQVEALERDNKALTTQRDHFQGEFADRQSKLNWWKEEYKKVCKATGYERPKKTSTYCTGTGYSDPNDPRAKPLPPMEGAPQKDLAQQLAQEKAAANAQQKEANAWLEQNNLPADDGYQFNGKQASAQATREKFADKRPQAEPASEERGKIDWKAMGRNHGNREAQKGILEAAGYPREYDYYNPSPDEVINAWGDLAK